MLNTSLCLFPTKTFYFGMNTLSGLYPFTVKGCKKKKGHLLQIPKSNSLGWKMKFRISIKLLLLILLKMYHPKANSSLFAVFGVVQHSYHLALLFPHNHLSFTLWRYYNLLLNHNVVGSLTQKEIPTKLERDPTLRFCIWTKIICIVGM